MVPCSAVRRLVLIALGTAFAACAKQETKAPAVTRPSILLVTLDTTRADVLTPANAPSFTALTQRGRSFRQAYATVPQTLPSHLSMFTGLYPAGHGVRENGRYLSSSQKLIAEELKTAGYRTAAFISAFAVDKRFGLARGFDLFDDAFPRDRNERPAALTTNAAIEFLRTPNAQPLFMWVHFYDPHYPYEPPEPFRTRFAEQPYLGEIAAMDEQIGRLVAAFEQQVPGAKAIIILADHGEGLGEHGEAQHGNLLYQSTMHVPLLVIGDGIAKGTEEAPVSTRRVYHTIRDLAGVDATNSLRGGAATEVVMGEAMKPFLDYGWQPQVMAVERSLKVILAGRTEAYDVVSDPRETRDIAAQATPSRDARSALLQYPIPSAAAPPPAQTLDTEAQRKLAALGYLTSMAKPVIRPDAPRPVDMARLFPLLDDATTLFGTGRYREAIPVLRKIVDVDPHNLEAFLELATSYSALGDNTNAVATFHRAAVIAPDSDDVRTYLALHYARGSEWRRAVPLLERVLAASPDRLPALEALAVVRERQNRVAEAIQIREKIHQMREPADAEIERLAMMQMSTGDTEGAIRSLEQLRRRQQAAFKRNLELGVVYLAARRYTEARDALDQVTPSHPDYAMALFKRAQVSVLLGESDARSRIETARRKASPLTRELIARERLFQGR